MKSWKSSESGISIVSALVGIGIASGLALVMATINKNSMTAQKSVSLTAEEDLLRSSIVANLDLTATLQDAGLTSANVDSLCKSASDPGGQKAPYLKLRRKSISGKTVHLGEVDGSGAFKGSYQIGDWYVRASCSAAEETLVVRVARKAKTGGTFMTDPLTGKDMSFDAKEKPIIGKDFPKPLTTAPKGLAPGTSSRLLVGEILVHLPLFGLDGIGTMTAACSGEDPSNMVFSATAAGSINFPLGPTSFTYLTKAGKCSNFKIENNGELSYDFEVTDGVYGSALGADGWWKAKGSCKAGKFTMTDDFEGVISKKSGKATGSGNC